MIPGLGTIVGAVVGGCLMAAGFARAIETKHPSLKTRVVEHSDELGYFQVGDVEVPDTADALLAKIDAAHEAAGK